MDLSRLPDLYDLLRRQDMVVLRRQHRAANISPATYDRLVARGVLVPLARGVHVHAAAPRTARVLQRAALLSAGGESALARTTAATLHGLPVWPDTSTHLLVRSRTFRSTVPGVVVHRSETWRPEHATEVDGLRVTTPARTLVDLASRLSEFQLRKATLAAVRRRLVTPQGLERIASEVGSVPGIRHFRSIIAELTPLHARADSSLESMFLEVTTAAGIPPTAMNHPVEDVDGSVRRIDAVYLPEHVPVELDGRTWHGLMTDVDADRRRENAIVLAGPWRSFLRFGWRDLTEHTRRTIDTIHRALAAARSASI